MSPIHRSAAFTSSHLDSAVPPLPQVAGRPKDTTEVRGTFRVTEYRGLVHGRSGVHQIAEGIFTPAAATRPSVIDTWNVELAMNVASRRDPHGLPQERPLLPGETFQVEGEYIPASKTHLRNASGPAAVVHFTHAPGGFVVLDGTTYRFIRSPFV